MYLLNQKKKIYIYILAFYQKIMIFWKINIIFRDCVLYDEILSYICILKKQVNHHSLTFGLDGPIFYEINNPT